MGHAIILEINSCRNACLFCSSPGILRDITPDEYESIIRHAWVQAADLQRLGVQAVEISGADPMEHPKVVHFVEQLKRKLGFSMVWLSTHGRTLRDASIATKLAMTGIDALRIPLYGPDGRIHDQITRRKGSFEDTVTGIRLFADCFRWVKLILTSLFLRQNAGEIRHTFDLMNSLASEIRFSLPCVWNQSIADSFMVSFDELRTLVEEVIKLGEDSDKPFWISDIPYCVLGRYHPRVINQNPPPKTAPSYSIPKPFASEVPFTPSYRVKTKLSMCLSCKVSNKCDGVYNTHMDLFKKSMFSPL